MFMDEGFIFANKFRRVIFDELAAGENDIKRIVKKNHLIPWVAQHIINEFIKGGIVEKKGISMYLLMRGKN